MLKRIKRDSRVNIRLPRDLLVWAKEYAQSKETTVTQLFIDHLDELKKVQQNGNA